MVARNTTYDKTSVCTVTTQSVPSCGLSVRSPYYGRKLRGVVLQSASTLVWSTLGRSASLALIPSKPPGFAVTVVANAPTYSRSCDLRSASTKAWEAYSPRQRLGLTELTIVLYERTNVGSSMALSNQYQSLWSTVFDLYASKPTPTLSRTALDSIPGYTVCLNHLHERRTSIPKSDCVSLSMVTLIET